jgi:cytoskeletal protein CcmA (bactofilin family)
MFTKKPEAAPADVSKGISPLNTMRPGLPAQAGPAPRPVSSASAGGSSVIGTDLTITGNLQSKGEVQIEGQVQGDLQASRIIVGQGARITGGIVADDVIVQGTVMGSIRGNRVTLQSSSKVEGDIFHQSLAIEQGAFFEGKSRRSENPIAEGRATNGLASDGTPLQNGAMN